MVQYIALNMCICAVHKQKLTLRKKKKRKRFPRYPHRYLKSLQHIYRSSHPEVFLVKGVLKICSKRTGEHPCRSAISIKLKSKFIEIALRHGCFPVNLLHIFRTPFTKNTSRGLRLYLPVHVKYSRTDWLRRVQY